MVILLQLTKSSKTDEHNTTTHCLLHSHQHSTFLVLLTSQSLRQAVRRHNIRWNVLDPHGLIGNLLPDEMMTDRNMFGSPMTDGILGELQGTLIIRIQDRR